MARFFSMPKAGVLLGLVALAAVAPSSEAFCGFLKNNGNTRTTTGPLSAKASIFDYSVKDAAGNDVSLRKFEDKKALLIVNVASRCGLTASNYAELKVLQEKYGSSGYSALAFPCNQFGGQEPGSNAEIQAFAKAKGATYPVFAKIDVNGPKEDPLYTLLKKSTKGFLPISPPIPWNFGKFLVVDGVPSKRYEPTTSPLAIEKDIRKALGLE